MKKLRVAVIGTGIGRMHLKAFHAHPGVELVAVSDLDETRAAAAAAEFSVPKFYTCAETMLAKETPDLVSVCTPNRFHHPLTLAALAGGAHVLCEKPMAMNAAEAREMLAAARSAGRRIMINFSYRFTPQSVALQRQVATGILGDIYFGRTLWHRRRGLPGFGGWFGLKEFSGGGPLIDLGVHRLDLALWLMGYPKPAWVLGAAYDPIARERAGREGKPFTVEDLAAASIRFENGAMLMVEASWACNQKEAERMETTLYGTRGGLVQRNVGGGYQFEAELYFEREGCPCDLRLEPPAGPTPTPMAHFADAILNDTPHLATGEEGVRVMELLDAIYESAATGAPVRP